MVELHDQYVAGKRSHGFGRHLKNEEKVPPEPVVTAVAPAEIDRLIGARTYADRLRHLRRLRGEGFLIHQPGRLTAQMGRGKPRAYVFRCQAHDVPRVDRSLPAPGARSAKRRTGGVWAIKSF